MAIDTGDKVTRKYSNFRGVDFRSTECAINRSPDALNVWRNYNEQSCVETRPAISYLCNNLTRIASMQFFGDVLYYVDFLGNVHKVIFNQDGSYKETRYIGNIGLGGKVFLFDGSVYAIGDRELILLDGQGDSEYFIPTTSIGALPDGTGRETYQDVNLLTPKRINTFHMDKDEKNFVQFRLDAENVDKKMPIIKIDGEKIFGGSEPSGPPEENEDEESISWYFNSSSSDPPGNDEEIRLYYNSGTIVVIGQEFKQAKTKGEDNIEITFSKTIKDVIGADTNKKKVTGCTIVEEFDNRIFLSGNPEYPNLLLHSSLNNPMYFSDLDVYEDGKDDGRIRDMVAGNGVLWVFRETDKGNGVYYHTSAFDATYGKVYPSTHSNIPTGCVGRAVNFLDDIVFFSKLGMESVSQNIESEQFATHKSSAVDAKMVNTPEYRNMVLVEWEGYLLVCVGTDVFLADSRLLNAIENRYEYEWYHWKLGKYNITCATQKDGILYIGTEGQENQYGSLTGNIYTLKISDLKKDVHHDEEVEIESHWTTPKDMFSAPNKTKTTNKKGFIVEAKGDISLSAKTDSSNFETIGAFTDVKDHFVSRLKRKKFKDLQLKFASKTKFKLESATLECFVGGYIKR